MVGHRHRAFVITITIAATLLAQNVVSFRNSIVPFRCIIRPPADYRRNTVVFRAKADRSINDAENDSKKVGPPRGKGGRRRNEGLKLRLNKKRSQLRPGKRPRRTSERINLKTLPPVEPITSWDDDSSFNKILSVLSVPVDNYATRQSIREARAAVAAEAAERHSMTRQGFTDARLSPMSNQKGATAAGAADPRQNMIDQSTSQRKKKNSSGASSRGSGSERGGVSVSFARFSNPPARTIELFYDPRKAAEDVMGVCTTSSRHFGDLLNHENAAPLRRDKPKTGRLLYDWAQNAKHWEVLPRHLEPIIAQQSPATNEQRTNKHKRMKQIKAAGNTLGPLLVDAAVNQARQRYPRIIVVGDVHGCIDEFQMLLRRVDYQAGDVVVTLGDLVAKGPDSCATVQMALEIGAVGVRGNHELEVLRWHHVIAMGGKLPAIGGEHYHIATALSKKELDWIHACPWYMTCPSLGTLFVHAGFVAGTKLQRQNPRLMINMRSVLPDGTVSAKHFSNWPWARLWEGPETVLFGHDADRGLQLYDHAMGIDTGCVYGGRLTACILPEKKLISVAAKREYIPFRPRGRP